MANININVEAFQCEPIQLGPVYRQAQSYKFTWDTLGDQYLAWGMNVTIKLYYMYENVPPYEEYTAQTIPFSTSGFEVNQLPGHDTMSFRLQMIVEGECTETVDIPSSSIITI